MIDALFGSKTRVKLLHLFLNHPGQSFYVREITRVIDEQINSVRRELSNMIEVGVIVSNTADNKLYYEVNQRYEYYVPLRAIFADEPIAAPTQAATKDQINEQYLDAIRKLTGVRVAIIGGVLMKDSKSSVDVLLVGSPTPAKVKEVIALIEKGEAREINYTVLTYEDFYYRLSVRDRFVTEITNTKHTVVVDTDNVLRQE